MSASEEDCACCFDDGYDEQSAVVAFMAGFFAGVTPGVKIKDALCSKHLDMYNDVVEFCRKNSSRLPPS